jgi:hypothetical protein
MPSIARIKGRTAVALLFMAAACGPSNPGQGDGDASPDEGAADAGAQCVNLQCFQVTCTGGGTTSVSGTVYAPNGTLPLPNVTVYVPNAAVAAIPEGVQCDRCQDMLSGSPLIQTTTDVEGRFVLPNMPATGDVPLVLQVGKWRRQLTIPLVAECVDTPVDQAITRLPRNKAEGDIPQMALTTGDWDALECLLRKVGLDDSEITTEAGDGRLHLYKGNGTPRFDSGMNGGAEFTDAAALWSSPANLAAYDVLFLSCEGGQRPETKGATALQAVHDYAGVGGRVFASHWHNYWLEAGPGMFSQTISRDGPSIPESIVADIDMSHQAGSNLAAWLMHVGGSTELGKIAITEARRTVTAINQALAQRWIYLASVGSSNSPAIQYMSFTTPLEQPEGQRCGKFVFSDMHVSAGDNSASGLRYPNGCVTTELSPQEKVLAFMIFDIASCVGPVVE